jgi:ABC-type Fe3+/spermidine/putrescine transport system ATPase subunit
MGNKALRLTRHGRLSRLRLLNLSKRFDEHQAVERVTLDVEPGELVTLLGPSGCGKTTTLRMIAGFLSPDLGEIRFNDRLMNNVPPQQRNTAMVFQSYALFPHMTVEENVRFGLKMRRVAESEQARRVAEAMAMVNLSGLEKRRPAQLSGGQQQRVALARAVVTQPDILLFDEPLSNLDAKLREKVRLEIRELQQRLGITTVYVTHDQAEALTISDRIVVMNQGKIEQIGSPDEIYHRPTSSFVADFLGQANIIEGRHLGGGAVETQAGLLQATAARGLAIGSVKLSWRPEDMKLAARPSFGSGRTSDANRLTATAKQVIFRGNFVELILAVGAVSLRAQVDSNFKPQEEDQLIFDISPDRIRIVG